MRPVHSKIQTEHGHVAGSGAEKRKDRNILDANNSRMQRWLDETPKEEPWTSVSYQAKESKKDSK